jgi:SCY1-like protein 1
LGKISKNLGTSTRSKVLIAAFTRSLRDPFVHARNAALMALAVTNDAFSEEDSAARILPALCPCLIDKEKLVRDQANKTIDVYLARTRKFASTMADTVLPPPNTETATASTPRMSTPVASEAASWAGWAISSFTNKVSQAAGEIQESPNNAPEFRPSPSSATDLKRSTPSTASASPLHRQAVVSPPTSTTSNANNYFQDAADDDEDDAWGAMEEEAFFDANESAPKTAVSSTNPFDDQGEPDFAGWLAAQAGKKPGAKPLPKGLAKASTSTNGTRPGAVRSSTTGSVGVAAAKKTTGVTVKSKPVVAKKIDTAPKATDEDDGGWGDGW